MRLYYRAKPNGRSYQANSEPPFHKVTHRHDKSIPGCTPASREGIYRPDSSEKAQTENFVRAAAYANDVQLYINGELPKEHIFRSFNVPVYGAYGERL